MKKQRSPFKQPAYIGLVLIGLSIVMMIIGRNVGVDVMLPDGFSSVILALEFAETSTGLNGIVQQLSDLDKTKLIWSTWLDMGFLIVYGSFLFTMLRSIHTIIGVDQYKRMAYLGVLAALTDVGENLLIIQSLNGQEINIQFLQIFTWVKWLSLALAFLFIGRFLTTTGRLFDKMLGVVCFVPFPLGLISLLSIGNFTETFAGLFWLLFPLTILYSWFSGIQKH